MKAMVGLEIVSLAQVDATLLAGFTCGAEPLDSWFKNSARTDDKRSACRVHICLDQQGCPIAFFTLAATCIDPVGLSRSLQGGISNGIPATLLGKLGVRCDLHGKGYGSLVLESAKDIACQAASMSASRLLVVDALSVDLVPWYEARGFVRIPGMEKRLVCKLQRQDIAAEG